MRNANNIRRYKAGLSRKVYPHIDESEFKVNIISRDDSHPQIYNKLVFNFLIFFPLTTTLKATLWSINYSFDLLSSEKYYSTYTFKADQFLTLVTFWTSTSTLDLNQLQLRSSLLNWEVLIHLSIQSWLLFAQNRTSNFLPSLLDQRIG